MKRGKNLVQKIDGAVKYAFSAGLSRPFSFHRKNFEKALDKGTLLWYYASQLIT